VSTGSTSGISLSNVDRIVGGKKERNAVRTKMDPDKKGPYSAAITLSRVSDLPLKKEYDRNCEVKKPSSERMKTGP
jgi:hypothetical protein